MQTIGREMQEWVYKTALTSGADVLVSVGAEGGNLTYVDCRSMPFLTLSAYSNLAYVVEVQGSFDAFSTLHTMFTVTGTGGSVFTIGSASAPYSGNAGYVILPVPYVRIRFQDAATGAHSTSFLYARCWG